MKKEKLKKSKESLTKKVLRNTFFNFLTTIIGRIGGLVFSIIVARTLFPELFGIYSLALAIILTVVTFTDLGLSATITRYLSDSLAKRRKREARSRVRFLLNFRLLLTLFFALIIFIFSNIIAISIFKKPLLILPLQLGSLYIIVASLVGFFQSVFIGLQKLKYNSIAEAISQFLRIIFVIILFLFLKTVGMVFVALIISLFISLLFFYLILSKKYLYLLKGKIIPVERKRLLKFFSFLSISSISFVFFIHTDVFMLGYFLPSEFVGFYSAIFSITITIAALFISLGSVFLPAFTQIQLNYQRLKRGFGKVFHYSSLLAIPAAIGLAYVAIPFLQIIYGQAYVPIQYKLTLIITAAILSFLVFEACLSALYLSLFASKESTKLPAFIMLGATIINIALNYILISSLIKINIEYGLIGAALATIISRYFYLFFLTIYAKKKLKITPKLSSIFKPLISAIVMLTFLFIFDYFVPLNLARGIAMAIIAMLIYFAFMFLIKGIKKEDLKILKLLR